MGAQCVVGRFFFAKLRGIVENRKNNREGRELNLGIEKNCKERKGKSESYHPYLIKLQLRNIFKL